MVALSVRHGGILLGKTNTPEFTLGGGARGTYNLVYGQTYNPYGCKLQSVRLLGRCGRHELAAGGSSLRYRRSGLWRLDPRAGLRHVSENESTLGRSPRTGHIVGYGGAFDTFPPGNRPAGAPGRGSVPVARYHRRPGRLWTVRWRSCAAGRSRCCRSGKAAYRLLSDRRLQQRPTIQRPRSRISSNSRWAVSPLSARQGHRGDRPLLHLKGARRGAPSTSAAPTAATTCAGCLGEARHHAGLRRVHRRHRRRAAERRLHALCARKWTHLQERTACLASSEYDLIICPAAKESAQPVFPEFKREPGAEGGG